VRWCLCQSTGHTSERLNANTSANSRMTVLTLSFCSGVKSSPMSTFSMISLTLSVSNGSLFLCESTGPLSNSMTSFVFIPIAWTSAFWLLSFICWGAWVWFLRYARRRCRSSIFASDFASFSLFVRHLVAPVSVPVFSFRWIHHRSVALLSCSSRLSL
jgi:hypothetical protein